MKILWKLSIYCIKTYSKVYKPCEKEFEVNFNRWTCEIDGREIAICSWVILSFYWSEESFHISSLSNYSNFTIIMHVEQFQCIPQFYNDTVYSLKNLTNHFFLISMSHFSSVSDIFEDLWFDCRIWNACKFKYLMNILQSIAETTAYWVAWIIILNIKY